MSLVLVEAAAVEAVVLVADDVAALNPFDILGY